MSAEQARTPRWERWFELVWDAVFVVCLALPTAFAVANAPSPAHALTTLGLAAGLLLWHWGLAMRVPEVDDVPRLVWFAGVLAFTWVLVSTAESNLAEAEEGVKEAEKALDDTESDRDRIAAELEQAESDLAAPSKI